MGVSAGGAGAIAIGRDAIGNIFVTGDYNQVFVGAYERLKDAYINPVSVLKRLRLEQFVGRGEVTSRLDDFFEKQRKGYFVVEGAAGLGKSTLLAHLVTERGYIHHFVELAPGPEKVVDGLKNLAAQVIRAWLMDPSGVDSVLPTSAGRQDFLRTLLVDAAARRDELRGSEKIVVVIDALDEAAGPEGTNGFPLPPDLPEGVYFIVSQRPGTRLPVIQAPFKPFTIVADSPENLGDMSEYLQTAVKRSKIAAALEAAESMAHNGPVTENELQDRLARRRQNFQDTLLQKCNGVWIYLGAILDEIERNDRSVDDLAALPDNLWRYYAAYWMRWQDEHAASWDDVYLPLIATLAAVREAVSLARLCELANVPKNQLAPDLLSRRWRAFLSTGDEDDARYRLYHTSLREFMEGGIDPEQLTEDQRVFARSLATATREAHQRIIARYWSGPATDWSKADEYALRNLVGHLQAALALARKKEQAARAADLYSVVLNSDFRATQRQRLGDLHASLTDLRTTLQVASGRNDLVDALACVGAYRAKAIVGTDTPTGVADEAISAAEAGDFDRALRNAAHYEVEADWARVLHLYLAWQAAEQGDDNAASDAVKKGGHLPVPRAIQLCDALLVRTARVLAQQGIGSSDPLYWLSQWGGGRDAAALFAEYRAVQPLGLGERDVVLNRVHNQFATLVDTAQGTDLPEAWVSAHPFASNAEPVGVPDLAKDLLQVIDTADGRNRLRWLVELFVTNPYPRYRDLALVALGRVCVSVPDPVEARGYMQSILRAALDQEGITFTFDLPSLVLAEATRRGLPAPDLVAYLDEAKRTQDRWTTPVRIQSATALAEHYLGRAADAERRLRDAHQQLDGYAGFSVLAALSLANRWCEFGKSQDLELQALVGRADQEARRVRDPKFSEDRFMLVQRYRDWLNQGPPSLETALATFAVMEDADERTTYVDYISACWSVTGPLPQLDWLKAFVASSLGDGTRLDAVLARFLGHRLASLSNDQLTRTVDICARRLATAKPWAAPKMVGPG